MAKSSTSYTSENNPRAGRPKGIVNRKIRVGTEFAQSFLKDTDYQDSIRLILGNPNHEHFRWAAEMMMAYAYGKPTENIHQTSDGSLPSHQFQVAFLDYNKFFALEDAEKDAEKEVGNGVGNNPPSL
jgi:hypothetical protein